MMNKSPESNLNHTFILLSLSALKFEGYQVTWPFIRPREICLGSQGRKSSS